MDNVMEMPSTGAPRHREPHFGRMPRPGEPAPWFHAPTPENPRFSFNTLAGRRVVLCFFGAMTEAEVESLLRELLALLARFDDNECVFFGVSVIPNERHRQLFQALFPRTYLFLDYDGSVSRLYGVASADSSRDAYRATSFVLDERLRVLETIPLVRGQGSHLERIVRSLTSLPPIHPESVMTSPAPVLVVPRIFEPALCQTLIDKYDRGGSETSGFMRDVDGKTILVHDPQHKRRRDHVIEDETLRNACMHRIHDRLLPEIEKAFQFRATRIERYIVACYDAGEAGHFRPHRDNTTKGTAHRRFAVTINLNTGDYQGGLLRFPEFGRHLYQPPAGGAIVFSCSLLHEATAVTKGKRYAFLPFLYNDADAKNRATES